MFIDLEGLLLEKHSSEELERGRVDGWFQVQRSSYGAQVPLIVIINLPLPVPE